MIIGTATVLLAVSVLEAQEGGLRMGGKSKSKPPPPGSRTPPPQTGPSGSVLGWIMKFDLAKEGESDETLGVLSIKPLPKGSRAVKLKIKKSDTSIVQWAGHSFDSDAYIDVLKKGLLCTVEYSAESNEDAKKKSKQKELRSLRFETSDVKGRIEEITEDYIVIKCKPTNDGVWPDMRDTAAGNAPPGNMNSRTKPKATPPKKLKLRIFEDASSFTDSENKPLDSGDFETNQDVEATIVYGRNEGMLVKLRALSAKSSEGTSEDQPPPRDTGGSRGATRGLPNG
jgi:hypothetical protein